MAQVNKDRKNKQVSADTQAIIDRLVREGDLVRNDGSNSIRAVKIELSRFADVFKTISTSLVEQNSLIKQTLDLAQLNSDVALAAEAKRQFLLDEELDLTQNRNEEEAEAAARARAREKLEKEKEKNTPDISLKERMIKGAGATFNFAKSFAQVAAGLFIGYNIVKGMIDKMTGGKFTEIETKSKAFLSGIAEFLSDPKVWLFGSALAIVGFRSAFGLLGLAFGTLTKTIGLISTGLGSMFGIPSKGGPDGTDGKDNKGGKPGKPDKSGGKLKFGKMGLALRGGIASLALFALAYGLDELKEYLEKEGINTTANVGNIKFDYVDSAGKVGKATLIGLMVGGPFGAMLGAIAGLAWAGSDIILDHVDGLKAKARKDAQDAVDSINGGISQARKELESAQTDSEKYIIKQKSQNDIDAKKAELEKTLQNQKDSVMMRGIKMPGDLKEPGMVINPIMVKKIAETEKLLRDLTNAQKELDKLPGPSKQFIDEQNNIKSIIEDQLKGPGNNSLDFMFSSKGQDIYDKIQKMNGPNSDGKRTYIYNTNNVGGASTNVNNVNTDNKSSVTVSRGSESGQAGFMN